MNYKLLLSISLCVLQFAGVAQEENTDTLDLMSIISAPEMDSGTLYYLEVKEVNTNELFGSAPRKDGDVRLVETGMPNYSGEYVMNFYSLEEAGRIHIGTKDSVIQLEAIIIGLNENQNCTNWGPMSCFSQPKISELLEFGVDNYSWEFTQVAPVYSDPWIYTTESNDERIITKDGICYIEGDDGKSNTSDSGVFDVRVRINFIYNNKSDFGYVECLSIVTDSGGWINENFLDPEYLRALNYETFLTEIALYPNPAKENTHVNLNIVTEISDDNITIIVKNIFGRTVSTESVDSETLVSESYKIDLKGHKPGIYSVVIEMNGESYIQKLIIVE